MQPGEIQTIHFFVSKKINHFPMVKKDDWLDRFSGNLIFIPYANKQRLPAGSIPRGGRPPVIERSLDIEASCFIRLRHLTLWEAYALDCNEGIPNAEEWLHLVFFIHAERIPCRALYKAMGFSIGNSENLLLLNDDTRLTIEVPPGTCFSLLELSFTREWLQRHCKNYPPDRQACINAIAGSAPGSLVLESITRDDKYLLQELERHIMNTAAPHDFFIRHHTLSLVISFLEKIFLKDPAGLFGPVLFPQMTAVREKVAEYIYGKLPTLRNLAREFALSESSLQRHFKLAFGVTVYEYYLEIKMKKAFELLHQYDSVKDVAYTLGYEDISSFTTIFKKYAGVLPNHIRRAVAC